jgi:aspartyl-tRNA(Asn)/glutamyl-tRNA(Gln) amidotransferase subunit A
MNAQSAAAISYAADPGRISDLARDIRSGAVSPVDLAQRYLDRIAAVDPNVEAWRTVSTDSALADAADRAADIDNGILRGPLHGVPVGVKDIIDVAGAPTRCNSNSRAQTGPASADAEIVAALRTAGAIILGKTHTTEFAYRDPSPARNPHNLDHTPGGSSSGSGAAVAAGMVPAALGTQTMASVNRPAAYCGIGAFKPSTRLMPGFGIEPLSYLYDTVGFYGGRVEDAATLFEAVCPHHARHLTTATPDSIRIVIPDDPFIEDADGDIQRAMEHAAGQLRDAGHAVEHRPSPVSFKRLHDLHRMTMEYDIGRTRRAFLDEAEGQIGAHLLEVIQSGLAIPDADYHEGRREIDSLRDAFFTTFADADAFLWPATPKTAPKGLSWTGDAKYISPWTALGGPVVTMPTGQSAAKLPIGCLVAGAPGTDFAFAGIARSMATSAEDHDTTFA